MTTQPRDMRDNPLFKEAEGLLRSLWEPGTGLISDAADVSTNGTVAAFAAAVVDRLEGSPSTRIGLTNLSDGNTRVVTFGPNNDRLPRFSPDGTRIAFLSDRHRAGDFQAYLLDAESGAARALPRVQGWVEYLSWSPDGRRLLLGVAGHGADVSGGQGAVTSRQLDADNPAWLPAVEAGDESYRWRRVWLYELDSDRIRQITPNDVNVWEACWCGAGAIADIASPGPSEGLWYGARLHIQDIDSGHRQEIYAPRDQIGWPAASPAGRHLAVVEAVCSDRWVVAGDLWLIETASGSRIQVDTRGIDVTCVEWRSERRLLVAGHRGLETVIALVDLDAGSCRDVWASREKSGIGRYISVSGLDDRGGCVFAAEGFSAAPEIAAIRDGRYCAVKSFDHGYQHLVRHIKTEAVRWSAPDGLALEGWVLRPGSAGPHPLVMNVHGGPVWLWRPTWLGRSNVFALMLLARGYAIFLPNPRGSAGRGQDFARRVCGDMGGADTQDYLSGIDHLVRAAVADPSRLGVTGGSYGGYMSAWLITQDSRFAAAVPVAPVTNQVTEHLVSNIPHFVRIFLADRYDVADGKYFSRSPIMYASRVRTPTLNICGALDRCTPPEEALQFHNALREHDVKSVLVTYPLEGHGVRSWPASIDYAARVVAWFEEHLGAGSRRTDL
jgi:dipeptidyl aminopeptidase/acylaminoacyl peptidase